MFKSKKGQILAFAVVFIIIMAFGFILVNKGGTAKTVASIGNKQVNILSAYAEAEKAREYVKFSAEHSAALAAQELDVATTQDCFAGLDKTTFEAAFTENMLKYLEIYNSTDKELNVSALMYTYDYDYQDNLVTVKAFAQEPGIVVKSNRIDFTYTIQGYVETDFTCSEYQEYSKKKFLPI